MTIVQSAELALRSPARLSRRRFELPVEIGTGAVPHSDSEARFGREPFGVVTRSAQQRAGGVVADTVTCEQRCGDRVEDRLDGLVEFADLGVEGELQRRATLTSARFAPPVGVNGSPGR